MALFDKGGDGLAFHSAIRWGKPVEELQGYLEKNAVLINEGDPKTGNKCLHVAAQNGHLFITQWLISKGATINGQNGKGQTALHMSVEYDCLEQTKFLLAQGADTQLQNVDGHTAISGIEGTKTGPDAWDAPINLLKSAEDEAGLQTAFAALEAADKAAVDKAALVQTGMAKKKHFGDKWPKDRFMDLVKKF